MNTETITQLELAPDEPMVNNGADECDIRGCTERATHSLDDGHAFGEVCLCARHAAIADTQGYEPVALEE